VNVFFIESGDTLVIRLHPDTRIGPAKPPPANCFTQLFGLGAGTNDFDHRARHFDYRRRQFDKTRRPGWRPPWTKSLKGAIARLTEIEPSRQRLTHRNFPMSNDELTLRSYGVQDGETISLRVGHPAPTDKGGSRDELFLASQLRMSRVHERQRRDASALPDGADNSPAGGAYSLRNSKYIGSCKCDGDVWMMPRWISQSCPNLFAAGQNGIKNGRRPKGEFGTMPIYLPDVNDSKMSDVRESVTGYKGYV
jgi:hypothetical protein